MGHLYTHSRFSSSKAARHWVIYILIQDSDHQKLPGIGSFIYSFKIHNIKSCQALGHLYTHSRFRSSKAARHWVIYILIQDSVHQKLPGIGHLYTHSRFSSSKAARHWVIYILIQDSDHQKLPGIGSFIYSFKIQIIKSCQALGHLYTHSRFRSSKAARHWVIYVLFQDSDHQKLPGIGSFIYSFKIQIIKSCQALGHLCTHLRFRSSKAARHWVIYVLIQDSDHQKLPGIGSFIYSFKIQFIKSCQAFCNLCTHSRFITSNFRIDYFLTRLFQ